MSEPVEQPGTLAAETFGARLALAERYARWLAEGGTERGLLGPRERPRLWSRHLLNCAVLTDLIPSGARVADVGSGAGLPGMVVALRRPDLQVTLVEPLLRRSRFLSEVVADLGLHESVEVVRARAEDLHGARTFDVVTARAVAPLERLAAWCLPLLVPHGELLALKGGTAAEERAAAEPLLEQWGAERSEVLRLGTDPEPTWVVRVLRGERAAQAPAKPQRPGTARTRSAAEAAVRRGTRRRTTQSNRSGR
ncbi:MAG TPA: 16S rRNA (guanine(527)-N(7))-methyltransferase RsmG [Motilibacteraceae bacterium]|nr:16S rRNA (guanine(527)-N(7))-methyltransferase RsmG [Motilibacteraceae bacterium]